MFKVTWKGLIAHKLRFVLTGIAVILGVAFISGTFVFTATIQQTFDDLIANIYKGTDAQVRGAKAFKSDQGGPGTLELAGDRFMGVPERHALAHQVVGEVGRRPALSECEEAQQGVGRCAAAGHAGQVTPCRSNSLFL